MHRQPLLQLLNAYEPYDDNEASLKRKMLDFVTAHKDCFERTCREGHITASAWIVNFTGDQFLLTLHKKLKLWLPLGGHSEACDLYDIHRTALREAQEESGLKSLTLVSKDIFDICITDHLAYDFNFLLQTQDPNDQIKISDESIDLRWFSELPEQVKDIENLKRLYRKWKRWTEDKAKN